MLRVVLSERACEFNLNREGLVNGQAKEKEALCQVAL